VKLLDGGAGPARIWSTARHLRADQLVAQLRHRLRGWPGARELTARSAPAYPGCRWTARNDPLAPTPRPHDAGRLRAGSFAFLRHAAELGWPPRWDCPELPRLWQYNLHYFDWLWDLDYDAARLVARDWIRRHPLAAGGVGWEPYPLSLRLGNWLAVFWLRHRARLERDPELRDELWGSVYRQAEWLHESLELHLLANHLLENATALGLAGACFAGPAARRWRDTARALLAREIAEQVLPDGMHFERSPMYHARATYLVLRLLAVSADAPGARAALPRMLAAAAALRHPDGGIALLNDSAHGIAHDPAALLDAAARLGAELAPSGPAGPFALPDAGYFGFGRRGDYVVADAGPLGPDYSPAHGHADLLSFELSLDGRRVVVDAGVHDYEASDLRRYCRSVRAHNTIEIEGQEPCDLWGVFRVGRRPRPDAVVFRGTADGFRLAASHDGYRRVAGRPSLRRTLAWGRERVLTIDDTVRAERPVRSVFRLHFHPDWRVDERRGDGITLACGAERIQVRFAGADAAACEASVYCPEFGLALDNTCLALTRTGTDARVRVSIGTD